MRFYLYIDGKPIARFKYKRMRDAFYSLLSAGFPDLSLRKIPGAAPEKPTLSRGLGPRNIIQRWLP